MPVTLRSSKHYNRGEIKTSDLRTTPVVLKSTEKLQKKLIMSKQCWSWNWNTPILEVVYWVQFQNRDWALQWSFFEFNSIVKLHWLKFSICWSPIIQHIQRQLGRESNIQTVYACKLESIQTPIHARFKRCSSSYIKCNFEPEEWGQIRRLGGVNIPHNILYMDCIFVLQKIVVGVIDRWCSISWPQGL